MGRYCTALAILLLVSACGPKHVDLQPRIVPKTPLKGGIIEFSIGSYNGETLKGRILVGATVDPLVIDGRLMSWVNVELKDIRGCDKKDPLKYYLADSHVLRAKPDEIVTIQPGYWYGAKLHFFLFDKELMDALPDCFEANLRVRAMDRRIAAALPIRVSRTDKPPAPPQTPSEAPPTTDTHPERANK